jgi:hypothetical protein
LEEAAEEPAAEAAPAEEEAAKIVPDAVPESTLAAAEAAGGEPAPIPPTDSADGHDLVGSESSETNAVLDQFTELTGIEQAEPVDTEQVEAGGAAAESSTVDGPEDRVAEETPLAEAEVPEAEAADTDDDDADDDQSDLAVAALSPGELPESPIVIWDPEKAESYRRRLRKANARFVDDPHKAVKKAAKVVSDAIEALAKQLEKQGDELDPRRSADNPDTESLRVSLRQYRDFLERVLAL